LPRRARGEGSGCIEPCHSLFGGSWPHCRRRQAQIRTDCRGRRAPRLVFALRISSRRESLPPSAQPRPQRNCKAIPLAKEGFFTAAFGLCPETRHILESPRFALSLPTLALSP
jgi:hypothetical protein